MPLLDSSSNIKHSTLYRPRYCFTQTWDQVLPSSTAFDYYRAYCLLPVIPMKNAPSYNDLAFSDEPYFRTGDFL